MNTTYQNPKTMTLDQLRYTTDSGIRWAGRLQQSGKTLTDLIPDYTPEKAAEAARSVFPTGRKNGKGKSAIFRAYLRKLGFEVHRQFSVEPTVYVRSVGGPVAEVVGIFHEVFDSLKGLYRTRDTSIAKYYFPTEEDKAELAAKKKEHDDFVAYWDYMKTLAERFKAAGIEAKGNPKTVEVKLPEDVAMKVLQMLEAGQ